MIASEKESHSRRNRFSALIRVMTLANKSVLIGLLAASGQSSPALVASKQNIEGFFIPQVDLTVLINSYLWIE